MKITVNKDKTYNIESLTLGQMILIKGGNFDVSEQLDDQIKEAQGVGMKLLKICLYVEGG